MPKPKPNPEPKESTRKMGEKLHKQAGSKSWAKSIVVCLALWDVKPVRNSVGNGIQLNGGIVEGQNSGTITERQLDKQKAGEDSRSTMQDIFIAKQGEHKMCRMHMQRSPEDEGHIRIANWQGAQ